MSRETTLQSLNIVSLHLVYYLFTAIFNISILLTMWDLDYQKFLENFVQMVVQKVWEAILSVPIIYFQIFNRYSLRVEYDIH